MLTVLYPSLPPMHYRLWLPEPRLYVRETDLVNRRIIGTPSAERARTVREDEAEAAARQLIRETGFSVELRAVVNAPAETGGQP